MAFRTTFQYQPLDTSAVKSTRILTILPAAFTSAVECTLEAFSFSGTEASEETVAGPHSSSILSPQYEALSYAWGDESIPKIGITINECSFDVSPTLHAAIQHLRSTTDPRKIWIDAICIDQTNPEEKAVQIRNMQHIYANAWRVAVWLGEPSFDSKLGFAFVEHIYKLVVPNEDNATNSGPDVAAVLAATSHLRNAHTLSKWSALYRIMWRSWWIRAWVVQEVIVARDVLFLCGSDSCTWKEMVPALVSAAACWTDFLRVNTSENYPFHDFPPNHTTNLIAAVHLTRFRERKLDYPAWEWIRVNRLRLCRFAHDRIYSILGLTSEEFQKSIPIDYEMSEKHLFQLAFKACVEEAQSLDILLESQHSTTNQLWPSCWRLLSRCSIIRTENSANSWIPYCHLSADLSALSVKAKFFGAVTLVKLEDQLLPGLTRTSQPLASDNNSLLAPNCSSYWNIDPVVFEDLFIPITERWNTNSIKSDKNTLINIFLKMVEVKGYQDSHDTCWYEKTSLSATAKNSTPPTGSELASLQAELEQWLVSRTIIEHTGKSFGFAPDTAKRRDSIWLVQGCTIPVLLRPHPKGGGYIFLGDVILGSKEAGKDRFWNGFEDASTPGLQEIVLV